MGASTQLTATVIDGKGRAIQGATVTWSSGNGAVVEVSPAGVATAVGAGKAAVKASAGPANGSLDLTVDPAAADGVVGSPEPRFRLVVEALRGVTFEDQTCGVLPDRS